MGLIDHSQELNYFRRKVKDLEQEVAALREQLKGSEVGTHPAHGSVEELRAENQRLLDSIERCRRDPFDWLVHSSVKAPSTLRFLHPPETGLVSAIIPAYRGAGFLRNCLSSVWQQQVASHTLEVVLCDDGCPERTGHAAAEMAVNSPIPCTIVSHPDGANRGVAATRNLAMAHSRGEFIALLDIDDEWLPEKTQAQTAYLLARPKVPAVCSYAECVDLENRAAVGWSGTALAGFFGSHVSSYPFDVLLDSDPVINSTVMMRRSAVEESGGYTDVMAHQAEDWLLFQKLAIDEPIEVIPRALARYRVHASSYTSNYVAHGYDAGVRWETHLQLLHWLLQQPNRRSVAERVYRRFTPKLLATYGAKFRALENVLAPATKATAPAAPPFTPLSWRVRVLERMKKAPRAAVSDGTTQAG